MLAASFRSLEFRFRRPPEGERCDDDEEEGDGGEVDEMDMAAAADELQLLSNNKLA